MPKINSVTYTLTGGREVFRPGDIVEGVWHLDAGDTFSVRGVRVGLDGAAYTRWSPFDSRKDDKIGHEKVTQQWNTVFGKRIGENGPNVMLPAGEHKYNFRFRLPSGGLPSSFEGKYGAVRYWLTFEIDRPTLRFNIRRYKPITVLNDINVNDSQYTRYVGRKTEQTVAKFVVVGDQGKVFLHGQTDRGGYCPGEKIAVTLIAENKTQKDLGRVKASLIQEVEFSASGEDKTKTFVLDSVQGKELKKGEKRHWKNQLLKVNAVPPSTTARTCHIINVKYYVKVFVDISFIDGGDVVVKIPITIGTIPQGHTQQQQTTGGANNIPVIDASAAITYTRCNQGTETFTEGNTQVFPVISYTPMCAYVPNFTFVPKTGTTTQQTPSSRAPVTVQVTANPTSGTKSQTPPTVKQQAAVGPSPIHVFPVPSAPPLDAPPSYEEAIATMNNIPAEQSHKEQVPDTVSTTSDETRSGPAGPNIVILTFLDSFLDQFRSLLVKQSASLASFSGEVIALASQVIVQRGTWRPRTSIAVFTFASKSEANNWYEGFSLAAKTVGVSVLDVVIGPLRETIQQEKNVFSMVFLKRIGDIKTAEFKEYSKIAKTEVVPLRQKHGGVSICASAMLDHLIGDLATGYTLSLVQWQQLVDYNKYTSTLRSDAFKYYYALLQKVYKVYVSVIFQSEELSFLEEVQESIDQEYTLDQK